MTADTHPPLSLEAKRELRAVVRTRLKAGTTFVSRFQVANARVGRGPGVQSPESWFAIENLGRAVHRWLAENRRSLQRYLVTVEWRGAAMPTMPGTSGQNGAAALDALESAVARDGAFLGRMLADLQAEGDRALRSRPMQRGDQQGSRDADALAAVTFGGFALAVLAFFAVGFGWATLAVALTAATVAYYFARRRQRRWLATFVVVAIVLFGAEILLLVLAAQRTK